VIGNETACEVLSDSVAHQLSCEGEETLIRNSEADNLGAPKTILLVEDETFVRQAMAAALRSSGYTVLTATDGAQALEAYRHCSHPPDMLLSDMVMPGMSGDALAEAFQAIYPQGRVLLISGYSEELTPYRSFGCSRAFLPKPFTVDALIKAVEKVLGGDSLPSESAGRSAITIDHPGRTYPVKYFQRKIGLEL
jgi:two-component system, cell cycle sensor histidine kinase and response regulator CckA